MPSTKSLNLPQMDRKSKKPLMEKKRRARINECLSNLKNLLLECLKRDPAHTSKLEKADILEMTVHLLRDLQNQQLALSATMDNSVVYKFQHGYAECFMQVKHYADTVEGFDPSMRDRLLKHLDNRYRNIQNPIQTINPVAHIQDITHTNPSINAADTLGSMHHQRPVPLPAQPPFPSVFPLFPFPCPPLPSMLPLSKVAESVPLNVHPLSPEDTHSDAASAADEDDACEESCSSPTGSSIPWRPW